MTDILQKICTVKKQEVAASKNLIGLDEMQKLANTAIKNNPRRDFIAALQHKIAQNQPAVIAEIKKASPSKGVIRDDFHPAQIAQSYEVGVNDVNAACLSILTDKTFFQGCDDFLQQARNSCNLPCLRKDFMVDVYQIYQSAVIGADCILLIAACLSDDELQIFTAEALSLNMAVLVEVHNLADLKRALILNTPLIGINNRDLRTFTVDIQNTIALKNHIPTSKIIITESGISSRSDVQIMQQNGINAFLVGETFMRQNNPGLALAELFG